MAIISGAAGLAGLVGPAGKSVGTILTTTALVGGTLLQAAGSIAAGRAEQQAANARAQALEHQAAQARQAAGQERAASQRDAIEERRRARLIKSRALAVAAGSGGGAGDPTIENILGDIGEEGEFRALNELFIGEERARDLETQAALKVFESDQERRAGETARRLSRARAGAQVFTGAATVGRVLTSGGSGRSLTRFG